VQKNARKITANLVWEMQKKMQKMQRKCKKMQKEMTRVLVKLRFWSFQVGPASRA